MYANLRAYSHEMRATLWTLRVLASPTSLARSYNTVYAVRADALTQIASLRSATSHTPKPLGEMNFERRC